MNNLEFTLASLPTLSLTSPPPFADEEAFWTYVDHVPAEWRPWSTDPTSPVPVVAQYLGWDRDLRLALARRRFGTPAAAACEAPKDPAGSEWDQRAAQILAAPTPADAEQTLDLWRWEVLDDLASGHSFDQTAFFVYVLQLRLVLRRALLNPDRGQKVFDALHKQILADTDLTITTGVLT